MTLLAPVWLAAAMLAAAAVVVLHLFARRRPPQEMLPTARFVPPHSAQATTRTVRPTDLWLLLLRVMLLLAAGAAMARPVLDPARRTRAGIVLADVSRATPSLDELSKRLTAVRREGDVVIPFDSVPHAPLAKDGLPNSLSEGRGSLSAALIAALEARRGLGTRADSVDLTIISALREEEIDRATAAIRALWPGRITVERLDAPAVAPALAKIDVRGDPADPVVAAARLFAHGGGTREVRLTRSTMTSDDSIWASDSGRVLVEWPARMQSEVTDSAVALVAGSAVIVAPFARSSAPSPGAVIVRWADGTAAATERVAGNGCIRHVAVSLPATGDVSLRPEFGRLLHELAAPCSRLALSAPASDSTVARLRGNGASASAFSASLEGRRSLAPWLLALALLLAIIEPMVRRERVRT